jgi:hypothetical protein
MFAKPLTHFSLGIFQWYCCRDPQLFELPTRQRNLRLVSNSTIENPITNTIAHDDAPPADSKVTYVQGKKIILRPENFVEEEEDDEVYFERIHSEFKSRNLQSVVHEEDYEDVRYWPYEWLLKVDTEVSRSRLLCLYAALSPRLTIYIPLNFSITIGMKARKSFLHAGRLCTGEL